MSKIRAELTHGSLLAQEKRTYTVNDRVGKKRKRTTELCVF